MALQVKHVQCKCRLFSVGFAGHMPGNFLGTVNKTLERDGVLSLTAWGRKRCLFFS